MKSKSLIMLVFSLGFGVIAAIGINQVMKNGQANGQQPAQEMGQVVLAADHLDLHAELSEDNVKLENWPVSIIPPDAITSLEEIADQATTVRLSSGMPIIASSMTHKDLIGRIIIPQGMKVVAVRVSSEHTIGNLLSPGDKVDVIGIFKQRDPRSNRTTTTSKTFLKKLQVFSINNRTNAVERGSEESGRRNNTIVGLLVNEKQSEQLVFAQGTGEIKLVLRGDESPGDDEVDDLDEIMRNELLAGVPQQSLQSDKPRPIRKGMEVWLGGEREMLFFTADGSLSGSENSSGSGRRESPSSQGSSAKIDDDISDVSIRDNDRQIDDDQYQGE